MIATDEQKMALVNSMAYIADEKIYYGQGNPFFKLFYYRQLYAISYMESKDEDIKEACILSVKYLNESIKKYLFL